MAAIDLVSNGKSPDWSSPATGAAAVTVSDTVDDTAGPFRGLYVASTGNIKVTHVDGTVATYPSVPAGFILPAAITRVWSTGTTVATPGTNIVGLK